MLKTDIIWPASRRFKTKSDWEPAGFFSDCLCNSNSFDLMLGFFSSSAISVLADGFATFLYNGGRMRLIINDILTADDKDAIVKAKGDSVLPAFDLNDIESLKDTLSERGRHFFDCISWLIRNDRIEIRVIAPKAGEGIAHTKCGVFCDGLAKVGFDGSVNFSKTAFIDNKESLTACCSWDNEIERAKIIDLEEEFDLTFSGKDESVRYVNENDIKTRICDSFHSKDIDKLLQDEYEIIESESKEDLPASVQASLKKARAKVESAIEKIHSSKETPAETQEGGPKFPYPTGPKDYQEQAFQDWKNNNQKGLFAMATGTGKTITALNCQYEIYKKKHYYKLLILVPTRTLVDQWEVECRKFGFNNVVKVYSNNPKWSSEVESLKHAESFESTSAPISYAIICTYASYGRINVFSALNEFSRKQVLLVADECHNIGSGSIMNKLEGVPYSRRIGLSATPERQFDDAGNIAIRKFFGAESRYTIEYTMEKAIKKGDLCKYDYFPHVVRLTTEEMEEYMKISVKLAKLYSYAKKKFPEGDEIVKKLLLQRKNIIHKAANKLDVFKDIITARLKEKGDLKYTLVYAPEGNVVDEFDSEIFSKQDYLSDDTETIHIIDDFTRVIKDAGPTITVRQFTSESKEREEMLGEFASGNLQVLTSMKCLDEGVDVPRSELAIFCASTGNPRQFIQRRGRILRKHPDKHKAVIHDLVVIPEIVEGADNFEMEKNLLASELKRVRNFALLSENADATIDELDNVLNYYKISIFED